MGQRKSILIPLLIKGVVAQGEIVILRHNFDIAIKYMRKYEDWKKKKEKEKEKEIQRGDKRNRKNTVSQYCLA